MSAYKYYDWERKEHSDLFNVGLDVCEAEKVNRKLARHFGRISAPRLVVSSRFSSGRGVAYSSHMIKIGRRTSLGVLGHEWAHILNMAYRTGENHGKGFKRWNKKVTTYIRARDYFGLLPGLFEKSMGVKK